MENKMSRGKKMVELILGKASEIQIITEGISQKDRDDAGPSNILRTNRACKINQTGNVSSDEHQDFSAGSSNEFIPNSCEESEDDTNSEDISITNQNQKNKKEYTTQEKSSRKRKRNSTQWKRSKNALATHWLQMQKGQEYKNYKEKTVAAKSITLGNLCTENCRFSCSTNVGLTAREILFSAYHQLDINSKNILLFENIQIKIPKRTKTGAVKHRLNSYEYYVTVNTKKVRVCKMAFCAIFKFSRRKVDIIQNKIKSKKPVVSPDKRGKHHNRSNKIADDVKNEVRNHIKSFAATDSHYSRNDNPHKKYLSPLLNVNKMHKLYIENLVDKEMGERFFIKVSYYRNVFDTEYNLSFGHPKSDACSTCDAGKSTEEHQLSYKLSFEMQRCDREKAQTDPNVCYTTVDLQQTMPLPKLTTSRAFYLRQLWFYNLGVHCITTDGHKSYMLTWTENEAHRGSVEVISCLWTLIQNTSLINRRRHIIIWFDSCAGQNKNFNMIALHQLLILNNFERIDHKFPEVGHSYLDSDRDFGRIEKVLRKHGNIYTPEQYRDIISGAISVNGTLINMADHFRAVDSLPKQLKLKNSKTNSLKEKVFFKDQIKWIMTEEFGAYFYKNSYDPNTRFLKVEISNAKISDVSNVLNRQKIVKFISEEKIKNLKEQMEFIPHEHKWFYANIITARATSK